MDGGRVCDGVAVHVSCRISALCRMDGLLLPLQRPLGLRPGLHLPFPGMQLAQCHLLFHLSLHGLIFLLL